LQIVKNTLEEIQGQQPEVQYKNSVVESAEYEMCDGTPSMKTSASNSPEKMDAATNMCHYLDKDVGIQNLQFTSTGSRCTDYSYNG